MIAAVRLKAVPLFYNRRNSFCDFVTEKASDTGYNKYVKIKD